VIALLPPTISIAFGASSIPVKGSTSLTFTITNPNTSASLTGVGFTDVMPAGLIVSTPNSLTGSRGGGTITAISGSSSARLAGATLAANASCTFSISVTASAPGIKNDTTGAVTSNEGGTGGTGSASLSVNAPSVTTISLTSSIKPSNVGQAVTFTATVTSPAGTPTGVLSFKHGSAPIGTATLATGVASLTTSSLTLGAHIITASYGGSASFSATTSPPLTQVVQFRVTACACAPLQVAVTRMQVQAAGDAFASGASGAIANGFSEGGGTLITPRGDTLHFNFVAEPDADESTTRRTADPYGAVTMSALQTEIRTLQPDPSPASRVDDAFAGLAYGETNNIQTFRPSVAPKEWLLWADVHGTDWNTDPSAGDKAARSTRSGASLVS
jgi:Bacterial Ig-like domain (group 3)